MSERLTSSVKNISIALTSITLSMLAIVQQSFSQNKPNIIYILTDDQRYDELGILNPLLDTPNMNAIAENDVHFKNAFVTTALCSLVAPK